MQLSYPTHIEFKCLRFGGASCACRMQSFLFDCPPENSVSGAGAHDRSTASTRCCTKTEYGFDLKRLVFDSSDTFSSGRYRHCPVCCRRLSSIPRHPPWVRCGVFFTIYVVQPASSPWQIDDWGSSFRIINAEHTCNRRVSLDSVHLMHSSRLDQRFLVCRDCPPRHRRTHLAVVFMPLSA